MLLLNGIILFLITLVGGLAVVLFPKFRNHNLEWVLSFGGAYLFSITIVHLIPELFESHSTSQNAIFLLLGFLLQLILDFFSQGLEHVHVYSDSHEDHHHSNISSTSLLVGLGIHAFLEGTLLSHSSSLHAHVGHAHSLLIGIILHKIPAAFALASVLLHKHKNKRTIILLLSIFALSTPLGMYLGNLFYSLEILSTKSVNILTALVAGSFLHISTAIFFETSPHHRFNFKRLVAILLGTLIAILLNFYLAH